MEADKALAATSAELDSKVDTDGITNSQEYRQDVDNAVHSFSTYDPSWAPGDQVDIKNPALVRQYLNDEARRLVQTRQIGGAEAVKLAKAKFRKNHSVVKGAWVRTGNHPLPDNVDQQLDSQVTPKLPQIRESIGDDEIQVQRGYGNKQSGPAPLTGGGPIEPAAVVSDADTGPETYGGTITADDLEYVPDPNHPMSMRVLYNGDPVMVDDSQGEKTPMRIDLTRAEH